MSRKHKRRKKQQKTMATQTRQPTTPYYVPTQPNTSRSPQQVSSGQGQPSTPPRSLWQRARKTLRGQFITLASALMLLSITLALYSSLSLRRTADDLDTIVKGSVPSINAAQKMAQYLNDIDAKSADFLATGGVKDLADCSLPELTSSPTKARVHDCDGQTINVEIVLFNRELYNAAHNVTYPGERTAIERITAGFQEYVGSITVMQSEYEMAASKVDPKDSHLKNAYQAYLKANNALRNQISIQMLKDTNGNLIFNEPSVPACTLPDTTTTLPSSAWPLKGIATNIDCLNAINKAHLDQAYSDTANYLGGTSFLAGLFGLIFCGLLLFIVVRMMTMTHRIINPGLSLALIIAVIFSIQVSSLFSSFIGQTGSTVKTSQHGAFQQIVNDDYASILLANQIKRIGTDANADESRWLIALEFNDTTNVSLWENEWQRNTLKVNGLIQKAQDNYTWPEEEKPLSDLDTSWRSYYSIDQQIRTAATKTSDPDRILTAERVSTGASNEAFNKFVTAAEDLGKANQGHFDGSYSDSESSLSFYIICSAILFPLLGLLAVWGIQQRLKDF